MKKLLLISSLILGVSAYAPNDPFDITDSLQELATEVMTSDDYNESAWNTALEVVADQLEDQYNEIMEEE